MIALAERSMLRLPTTHDLANPYRSRVPLIGGYKQHRTVGLQWCIIAFVQDRQPRAD